MKVRFAPSAERDFLEKLAYLSTLNPRGARALVTRVERALSRLAKYPNSGRRIPEFPQLPYREVVVPPYRVVFRVEANEVWIVAVWHSAQAPAEPQDGK